MAVYEKRNIVLTKMIDNVIYEIMVKTVSDMVYVNDEVTLTEKLSDITDLLTEFKGSLNELKKAYEEIVGGVDDTFNSFKDVWLYVNSVHPGVEVDTNATTTLLNLIESKVSKVDGKGLSTHDLTDVLYEKLVNGYTKEELNEKFEILIDGSSVQVKERLDKVESDISEIKSDIEKIKATPNIVVAENEEEVKDLPNENCWYMLVSKD